MKIDIEGILITYQAKSDCVKLLEAIFWRDNPVCPYCNSKNSTIMDNGNRHHCNLCNTSFSVTVDTIFHNTRLPLNIWFVAIALLIIENKDLTARELANILGINKNTAADIKKRIRNGLINTDQRQLIMKLTKILANNFQ